MDILFGLAAILFMFLLVAAIGDTSPSSGGGTGDPRYDALKRYQKLDGLDGEFDGDIHFSDWLK